VKLALVFAALVALVPVAEAISPIHARVVQHNATDQGTVLVLVLVLGKGKAIGIDKGWCGYLVDRRGRAVRGSRFEIRSSSKTKSKTAPTRIPVQTIKRHPRARMFPPQEC